MTSINKLNVLLIILITIMFSFSNKVSAKYEKTIYDFEIESITGEKINFSKYKNVSFKNKISHACKNSDLIILHTEWNEFKNLNFKKLVKKRNFIVYDLRNIYSHKKMINNNINYFGIGR